MRRYRLPVWGIGGLVCLTAVSWLAADRLPDRTYAIYREARSVVAGMAPVRALEYPVARPRDRHPCGEAPAPGVADSYFPTCAFDCRADELQRQWYSGQLQALAEPSLWALSRRDPSAHVYRFLWLRTFHHPICVRLDLGDERGPTLTVKMTSGAGENWPGRPIHNTRAHVGVHGVSVFSAMVARTRYWELPDGCHPSNCYGAQWVVEGVAEGHYHVVDRFAPFEGDPIRELGLTLLNGLAGIRIDRRDLY